MVELGGLVLERVDASGHPRSRVPERRRLGSRVSNGDGGPTPRRRPSLVVLGRPTRSSPTRQEKALIAADPRSGLTALLGPSERSVKDAVRMQETPERDSRRRGHWWKSLIAAWLALQAVAVVMRALGVEIPDEFGFPALIVLWAVVWTIWRRRSRAEGRADNELLAPGALGVMQRVFVAFCVAILLIGNVVLILDNSGDLERTDVSSGVVGAVVTVIGVLSLVGGRIGAPALKASGPAHLVTSYRSRFFARMAWAETPALVAFGGFLLLGGEAWVFGIGLAASLVGFVLAAPTRASLRRDQEQITATGSSVDLLEVMGVAGKRGQQ